MHIENLNTTKFLDLETAAKLIHDLYTGTGKEVYVAFQKRNGDLREMLIQENAELLKTIVGGRAKRSDTTKTVCEKLPDGTFQFRTIPLDRIYAIAILPKV